MSTNHGYALKISFSFLLSAKLVHSHALRNTRNIIVVFIADITRALIGQLQGRSPVMPTDRLRENNQSKNKTYNVQLLNLERSVFTVKSQTSVLPS